MAARRRLALKRAPLLYTAQDVARFCEVDLKTIHHWVAKGKIPHFRTEGRHLRFRRNDVVLLLRSHGYTLPDELSWVRPRVALGAPTLRPWPLSADDVAKKLSLRFEVRRHPDTVIAIAHLLADQPDVLVASLDAPSLVSAQALAALKCAPETSWIAVVALGRDEELERARAAGVDLALDVGEVPRLATELAHLLAL